MESEYIFSILRWCVRWANLGNPTKGKELLQRNRLIVRALLNYFNEIYPYIELRAATFSPATQQ